MSNRLFTFSGGDTGPWQIVSMTAVFGDSLPEATRLTVASGSTDSTTADAKWCLRGITSNERYVTRLEKDQLVAKQAGLGRPEAICAALIPIRKKPSWWVLPQDERRRILEECSQHVAIGMKYLPAVARRLHHCRDLGEQEPFDFLTWFEYTASDTAAFDDLVAQLRASEEWTYVEREADIRLVREES
ncbi:chlorite dismutase family protein [Stenomitos frigidus]|uniref:hydrogen peroxide-dependent heme synthase n=1 Tax=Stenomitos frigidus ULC18 TaxID=2107698 RepID=A0A2T1DZA2_9CYAN|nr:chlorite dismutase family protein [Stenomitos frigidus]PSB25825.1 chlorite dismutase [Stenomitos frigidus ULC18]